MTLENRISFLCPLRVCMRFFFFFFTVCYQNYYFVDVSFFVPPMFCFQSGSFFSSKHFLNLKNQFDGADECGLKYEINYLCVRQKMSSMRISFSRSCPKWKQERIEIDSIFGAEGLTVNFTWLLFMNIITLDLR